MPYKSSSIRLSETQDRRRRLTSDQQKQIRELYETGLYSWNQLAKMFGCSKSRIGQIVNPEREQKVKARNKAHWRDYKKSKEEWNATVREHRAYKQSLYLQGKLKESEDK